jgi:hypothetical protein
MVLHSVTLWIGAWESGSGWGLGVPILVLAPSLFPHSLKRRARQKALTTPPPATLPETLPFQESPGKIL